MDRAARARKIAATNARAAADRRHKAHDASPAYRRRLLLDAARLDDLAAGWRQVACEEEETAARAAVTADRCWCGRKLSTLPDTDGTGCAEHDGVTSAAVTA
jgi:hypothetical protein